MQQRETLATFQPRQTGREFDDFVFGDLDRPKHRTLYVHIVLRVIHY